MNTIYIPSFYLKGFKVIEDLEVKELAPMNLIAGDNNVGKSTLLEALYLLLSPNNIYECLLQLACKRFGFSPDIDTARNDETRQKLILSFFKNWIFNLGETISLQTKQEKIKLTLGYFYREHTKGEDGELYRKKAFVTDKQKLDRLEWKYLQKAICIAINERESIYSLEGTSFIYGPEQYSSPKNVQLIQTTFSSKEQNARLWNNISLTGLEKYVVKALQLIDPDVENLAFLKEEENIASNIYVPYITLKNHQGRYPLRIMGDGMNRILSLILSIVNCANGVCLIDEIENGIYYRRQSEIWEMIALLVEQLHIQIFATTHNLDCIRGFSEIATNKNAQLIRLEKRQKGLVAISYSAKELQIAMDKDIELR